MKKGRLLARKTYHLQMSGFRQKRAGKSHHATEATAESLHDHLCARSATDERLLVQHRCVCSIAMDHPKEVGMSLARHPGAPLCI